MQPNRPDNASNTSPWQLIAMTTQAILNISGRKSGGDWEQRERERGSEKEGERKREETRCKWNSMTKEVGLKVNWLTIISRVHSNNDATFTTSLLPPSHPENLIICQVTHPDTTHIFVANTSYHSSTYTHTHTHTHNVTSITQIVEFEGKNTNQPAIQCIDTRYT